MAINLLRQELAEQDATPFVKTSSTTGQPRQKPTKAFCDTQLAMWNSQKSMRILLLFVNCVMHPLCE